MYRLALAHDSNIATALSSVTVAPRRLAASTNVVGREDELAAISHEFERAHKGKARILVVSGEAGVGKTTLVDAFVSELEERGEPDAAGRGRCSERLAGTEAYLPYSRRSRACSGASTSVASRALSARLRRAGTRN